MPRRVPRKRRPHEPRSKEHGSQVAVRDGNRLICPCCGEVLMVLLEAPSPEPASIAEPASEGEIETPPAPQTETIAEPDPNPEPQPEPPPERKPAVIVHPPLDCNPPIGGSLRAKSYSAWDDLIHRQEAAWAVAWKEAKEQQEREHAEFLASDDPQVQADYLSEEIHEQIADYHFPEEEPPPVPGRKRPSSQRKRKSPSAAKESPCDEPWTYQKARLKAWEYYLLKKRDLDLQVTIRDNQQKIDQLRLEVYGPNLKFPPEPLYISDHLPPPACLIKIREVDLAPIVERELQATAHLVDDRPAIERFVTPFYTISGIPTDGTPYGQSPANNESKEHPAKERGPPH